MVREARDQTPLAPAPESGYSRERDPDYLADASASPSRPWHRGRGTGSRPDGRYEAWQREAEPAAEPEAKAADEESGQDEPPRGPATQFHPERSRRILTRNDSPDVPFSLSINPFRGCEHGCVYCYARPTHAYLGLSPGLDFETRIFFKPDAPALLARELEQLAATRIRRGETALPVSPLALGVNTDAYQPGERRLGLTRQLIEILGETRYPFGIVTKSALVERDIDLLGPLGQQGLAHVMISLTSLDGELSRHLEPRAASPLRRLEALARLRQAGVPTGVLFAPLIPGLNDHHLEACLTAAREAGALDAGYTLLRLPREVADLFQEWLTHHAPERRQKVLALLRSLRQGALNDSRFGQRMRGEGPFARVIAQRFHLTKRRLDFPGMPEFAAHLFQPPASKRGETNTVSPQMNLF